VDYEYILEIQPDVWIFYDNVEYFMNLGYDFYGAPLGRIAVENKRKELNITQQDLPIYLGCQGGFSLRKVSACLDVISKDEYTNDDIPEDDWWFKQSLNTIKSCPINYSKDFSFDGDYIFNRDKLPMGVHGILKNYWVKYVCKDILPFLGEYDEKLKEKPEFKIYDVLNKEFNIFYSKLGKTKVALCCIARNENNYIKEFVDYYIKLGVDKIFIYDNNEANGERVSDVIYAKKYPQVEIIDYIDCNVVQLKAYQDCYDKHNEEFDWIMFLDCDEFLTLVHDKTIQDYVNRDIFKDYDAIHVNWICYGDNGLTHVENGNYSVLSRFTEPIKPISFFCSYGQSENNHVKSIIRGKRTVSWDYPFDYVGQPHTPCNSMKACNNKGEECNSSSPLIPYNHDEAYIRHYITKSTEEYYKKMQRGYPDQVVNDWFTTKKSHQYFRYNARTKEAENVLGISNDSVDIFICTHKDFSTAPINKTYTILHGDEKVNIPLRQISEGKTGDTINDLQHAYSECSRMYWIWKNYKLKDYVGFCHYRRYFEFYNKLPNIKALIDKHGIITTKLGSFEKMSVREQYAMYHCVNDLDLVTEIINVNYHDQYDAFIKYLNGNYIYLWNMFIMKSDMFNKYCEFLFGVMRKFDEIRGFKTSDDVRNYVNEHKDVYDKTFGLEYQARMQSFLCERLTSFFIMQNFPNPCEFNMTFIGSEEKSKNCCVTIPVYKEKLTEFEEHSLIECVKKLSIKYEIHLVCPRGLNVMNYMKYHTFKVDRFDNEYFRSVKDYHRLLKSSVFYSKYEEFKYIFHYQLDSWIFEDKLDALMTMDFDYYGALHKINGSDEYFTGDGGVSLRKVSTFKRLTEELEREGKIDDDIKEDELFTKLGIGGKLKLSPYNISILFSINDEPLLLYSIAKQLPFVCRNVFNNVVSFDTWFKYISY
jgi:hypothetical protein